METSLKSKIKFWVYSLIIFLILRKSFNLILSYFIELSFYNPNFGKNFILDTISSIIISPIIETFLFFYLPFLLIFHCFGKFSVKMIFTFIFLSSLSFAAQHHFNQSYLLNAIFAGGLYSSFYSEYFRRGLNAYWSTVLLHANYNFLGILSDKYLY